MTDTETSAGRRRRFETRSSVLAAWFVSVVVVWPILSVFVAALCFLLLAVVLQALYPDLAQPGGGLTDLLGLVFGLPVILVAAVVAAIACSKTCRSLTVPLHQSRPLAFEIGPVMAVLIALTAVLLAWLLLTQQLHW